MNVAFIVNDLQLSGGIGVVVAHARQLVERHGFDVTLVLARDQEAPHWKYDTLEHLHVATLAEAHERHFDIAVGTWWETAFTLFTIPADRYAFFVQSLEDRFYLEQIAERSIAPMVLDLPVDYITEARWIRDTLADLRPETRCYYVRNGIDKDVFGATSEPAPRLDGPLRILVEGNPGVWFKGIEEAGKAIARMAEAKHVTYVSGQPGAPKGLAFDRQLTGLSHREMADLYGETDVLLKLSSVEGMFGPPLEAFHLGATAVVTPVTGYDEYVVHGWNGLVVDWQDHTGTARALDLLAKDRRLLHHLRRNALDTARHWPDWDRQGQVMASVLHRIAASDPPPSGAGIVRLMADTRSAMEAFGGQVQHNKLLRQRLKRFDRVLIATRMDRVLMARRNPRLARILALIDKLRGRG